MLLFENFNEIESICGEYNIKNYTINKDGSINVNDDVDLHKKGLTKLPLKFNKVLGNFSCSNNQLTSLEGGPKKVGGDYYCYDNHLTSLKGSPKEVGIFNCSDNKLTTLESGPKKVSNSFFCFNNKLTTLEGFPEEINGVFYFYNNPIYNIFKLFKDYKQFKSLLDDYNYLRGTRIIKARFEQACLDANIKIPEKIEGYTII